MCEDFQMDFAILFIRVELLREQFGNDLADFTHLTADEVFGIWMP